MPFTYSENRSFYPRVLILYNSKINAEDQHAYSLRSWFSNWPRDSLAQVYSGGESNDSGFCGQSYKLSNADRRLGNLFFFLKSSPIGAVSKSVITLREGDAGSPKINFLSKCKIFIGRSFLALGIWELIFRPKLSPNLIEWIQDFKPDIIYCQGYNLTFTWLPVLIQKKFKIPICFQTGDDWFSSLYSGNFLSCLIRPIVNRGVKRLLTSASVRIANGDHMAEQYEMRYSLPFIPIMMCDDSFRFQNAVPQRLVNKSTISILYTGSLGSERCPSLVSLCKAVSELQVEGINIVISALASGIPPELLYELGTLSNLQLLPAPSHDDLPSYLKGADILFLPESFNAAQATRISLSISTKAHLYMMSERPTLIYGSATTGIVKYGKKIGWGAIVDNQDIQYLKQAIIRLISDKKYCEKIVARGLELVLVNHEGHTIREKFRGELFKATLNF